MFHKSTRTFITTTIIAFLGSGAALAQGHAGDILLELDSNNRLMTSMETDGGVISNVRVFGSEFGEGGVFNFTDEPGFEAEDGTVPSGSLIGFNIRAALGLWNGSGFDTATESLTINFSSLQVTTGSGFVPGFGLPANSQGGYHRHLGFTLNGVTPDDSGIYLLEMEMWSDQSFIETSRPFWIVFNFNRDEAEHDLAIDWVNQNLVPAPGAMALLGLVCLGTRNRRRR